jgi:hypothetical protein
MFIFIEHQSFMNDEMIDRTESSETDLLYQAISAFNKRFEGLKGLELTPSRDLLRGGKQRADAFVHLISGKREVLYRAEIKARLSHALRILLTQHASLARPLLLVTQYVNPEMAEHLIRDGMEFIDTAGNAFINMNFLRIISRGNPPRQKRAFPSPRLFKASGLKVVFALLSRPRLVNAPLRKIASDSGVSLGTMAGIMEELKKRLYLVEDNHGARRLIRKKDLFESWVTAYPEQLRPKVLLGRYRGEHGWWFEKVLQPAWAQWGGEMGAARLTNYLYPQLITVYLVRSRLDEFLLENKLASDNQGNVEVLEKFWTEDVEASSGECVNPMLVYADLIASGSKRNTDTAKIIYDKDIARYLRED